MVRGPILSGFWEPFGTPGIHFEWILGAIWEPFANNSGHSRAKRCKKHMETQENSVAFSLFLFPRFGKTLYRMLFNRASRSIAKTGLFSVFFRVFFSRWFLEGVL